MCNGTEAGPHTISIVQVDGITSGGYHDSNRLVAGSPTSIPLGNYNLNPSPASQSDGRIDGFKLTLVNGDGETVDNGRTATEVHCDGGSVGTAGCVGIEDPAPEEDQNPDPPSNQDDPYNDPWMIIRGRLHDNQSANTNNCVHGPPSPIPVTVTYHNIEIPDYEWEEGEEPPHPGENPANPNNPPTPPDNPLPEA